MKIGILASGAGSNVQAIIERIASGALNATIEVVISNRPEAQVLKRASDAGIKNMAVERSRYANRAAYDSALVEILQRHNCEVIVLAGYMLVLGKPFLDAFPGRVVNIHPSLLPSFTGTSGAANAQNYGVKITGCTVHFVEEEIDTGPIIIQAAVPVHSCEDLSVLKQRIHALEHRIYPQALQWLAQGRLKVRGREVCLEPGGNPGAGHDQGCLVWPPLEDGF